MPFIYLKTSCNLKLKGADCDVFANCLWKTYVPVGKVGYNITCKQNFAFKQNSKLTLMIYRYKQNGISKNINRILRLQGWIYFFITDLIRGKFACHPFFSNFRLVLLHQENLAITGAGFVVDGLPICNIAQILNRMEVNHLLWSHFSEEFLIYQYLLKVFSKIKKKTFK